MTGRHPWSARLALIALTAVAAFSLGRCFPGPGEIVPALVAGVVANISVFVAMSVGARHRSLGVLCAIVGALVAFATPMWFTVASATFAGFPTLTTLHAMGTDLSQAWGLFNKLRSPVPEVPGFTLVSAWAVAVAALLSGWAAIDGDSSVWVVAPPAAIFLFTSALGTSAWRAAAIAGEVAALAWYLVAARSARIRRNPALVPTARTRAGGRTRLLSDRRVVVAVPAVLMIVVAALLAATIGPRLPGAVSPALVSLRDVSSSGLASGGTAQPPPLGQVDVSTLVQVAEEEIYQPSITFFTVTTQDPGYMVLTTLDTFNGDSWSVTAPTDYEPLPPYGSGGTSVAQETLFINLLGGSLVPALPVPTKASGASSVTYDAGTETLQTAIPLEPSMLFYLDSVGPSVPAAKLAPPTLVVPPSLDRDLQLPSGVPQRIISLAHSIVKGLTTPYAKALALQNYFQSGGFIYQLPHASSPTSPVATGGEGLADLVKFLFTTRAGFCQQYSSAYAVLARIDGLPTRIAVGFVPGQVLAKDEYQVTGTDVHAWPQVYLGAAAGWVDFEPTPGSSYTGPGAPAPGHNPGVHSSHSSGSSHGKKPTSPSRLAHNLRPAVGGTGPPPGTPRAKAAGHSSGPSAGGGLELLYGFGALGLVVLGAAPAERVVRRRRARSPAARVLLAWRSATNALGLVGLLQHRGESYNDLARRVAGGGALPPDVTTELTVLAGASTVATFSSSQPSAESVREAVTAARSVARAARKRAGPRRTLWAFFSPRGLLNRDAD
jgi:transglutaminase-like putative cysteine protease